MSALAHFWQLAHGAQAASADIHCTWSAVDRDTTALHIEYEAAASPMLRKWHIVAVHWLALTYVTTTCWHSKFLSKISTEIAWNPLVSSHRSVFAYLIILGASDILHQ